MSTGNGDGSSPTSGTTKVKLGSHPAAVYLHPDDEIKTEELIRYKPFPWEPWNRWLSAWVHQVTPIPFLEKM